MPESTVTAVPTRADEVVTTLSAERLVASTRTVPVRRAVLRKRIVTVEQTIVVPVRHEEFVLEYEELDEATDAATAAVEAGLPRGIELVLSEEVLEVRTVIRPVERVRVVVDRVMGERSVTGEVRAERIELDGEDLGEPAAGRHRD